MLLPSKRIIAHEGIMPQGGALSDGRLVHFPMADWCTFRWPRLLFLTVIFTGLTHNYPATIAANIRYIRFFLTYARTRA